MADSSSSEPISIGVTVVYGQLVKDVQLALPRGTSVDQIHSAITRSVGAVEYSDVIIDRTGQALLDGPTSGLLHGDRVHVLDGGLSDGRPLAGRLLPVGSDGPTISFRHGNGYVFGREVAGPQAIRLRDESVSGNHAELDAATSPPTLRDRSSNGTLIGRQRVVNDSCELTSGDIVQFGYADPFIYLGIPNARQGHLEEHDGRILFNRRPRPKPPDRSSTVDLPAPPEQQRVRKIPTGTMVVPVIMGVVIFLVMQNPLFLLFTAITPAMAIWNRWEDRSRGSKAFEDGATEYREALRNGESELRDARVATTNWWQTRHPSQSALLGRAWQWAPDLWERRVRDDDFLAVTVGRGSRPALVRPTLASGGDSVLRSLADPLLATYAFDPDVPVEIPLAEKRIVGIVGSRRDMVATSIVTQLAVHHSPRDVELVLFCQARPDSWKWASWLPHIPSHGGVPQVGASGASVRALFSALVERAEAGEDAAGAWSGRGTRPPWTVAVFDPPFELRTADVSRLLESAKEWPFVALWLGSDRDQLPSEITLVVDTDTSEIIDMATGEVTRVTSFEGLGLSTAAAIAGALAPLVDGADSADVIELPESVTLLDVLGAQAADPAAVAEVWTKAEGLSTPIGIGSEGIITIDLTAHGDGSHGLVAGTTGAGKSEFLRSYVAGLASRYSPDYLTFLFVDYKGGAAFRECTRLPHCVGVLTNLDEGLADRARRSLKAELEHRQRTLERYNSEDLRELRSSHPEVVMPTLLIVFDEFAQLAKDIPEFVDGLVDIAQVGRSLGVQAILATQTPGGVVNDKIQNNMRLRVAFRLEQTAESTAVIGSQDAANLPSDRPGRAYVRKAGNAYVLVQTAYSGAITAPDTLAQVTARTMIAPSGAPFASAPASEGATDLRRVVDAARSAASLANIDTPRRPWIDELPAVVPLDALGQSETGTPIGIVDLPDRQAQLVHSLDLARLGSVAVYGAPGAGKATFLRTLALTYAMSADPKQREIIAIEGRPRALAPLAPLPHLRARVRTDDHAAIRQLLEYLSLALGNQSRTRDGDHILVLIDALPELLNVLESLDGGAYHRTLIRLLSEGPAEGMVFAIATDQPQRIPMAIANTIGRRIVLKQASIEAYQLAGVNHRLVPTDMPPGRAILGSDGTEIQLAIAVDDEDNTDEAAQTAYIKKIGNEMRGRGWVDLPRLETLPSLITSAMRPDVNLRDGEIVLGLDDLHCAPATIDFARTSTLLIGGPARSGRTTTLEWVRDEFRRTARTRALTISTSGRTDSSWDHEYAEPGDAAAVLARWTGDGFNGWTVVALDDVDDYLEIPMMNPEQRQMLQDFGATLDRLLRQARGERIAVLVAGTLNGLNRAQGWPQTVRRARQALLLEPQSLDTATADPLTGVRLLRRSGYEPRPGLGVLDAGPKPRLIQVFATEHAH